MIPETKSYQYYADCPDEIWDQALTSKKGFFHQVFKTSPPQIIGPNLCNDGTIIGDMWIIESMTFTASAAPEQVTLYKHLEKENIIRAREYVLHVINSLSRWREDIKHLAGFLNHLKMEESYLTSAGINLLEYKRPSVIIKNIPRIFKKHFPGDFNKMKGDYQDIVKMTSDIESAIKHITSLEQYIISYLDKLQVELPFLFKEEEPAVNK